MSENHVFSFREPPFNRISTVLSPRIPYLSKYHAFSLRKSPI
ncbi:hypothetical protein CP10139811_1661 [Chlamydia ibidis]|uniref:Uncharacterized protein n=1 Tax=Chlamydia ibidis TaxID=1405396 RepID=S7J5Z5_9CHLA|nr:hypothetical protein CP10139811_1661 [Chlamydia ibidis]